MGNFITRVDAPPVRGEVYTIVDTAYTKSQEFPRQVFGQGAKVKIVGSKNLLASRPNAPPVMVSIVQFPNGKTDVYPSANLRKG